MSLGEHLFRDPRANQRVTSDASDRCTRACGVFGSPSSRGRVSRAEP
jgi:hypothetical protein